MKNKVLVKIIVPEIGNEYDVFIPVNELVWKIKALITKSISDLSGGVLDASKEFILLNKTTGEQYQNNVSVYDTNIRNATELILITKKDYMMDMKI